MNRKIYTTLQMGFNYSTADTNAEIGNLVHIVRVTSNFKDEDFFITS